MLVKEESMFLLLDRSSRVLGSCCTGAGGCLFLLAGKGADSVGGSVTSLALEDRTVPLVGAIFDAVFFNFRSYVRIWDPP